MLAIKKVFEQRMEVTEMCMLRWMSANTMMDWIRNQEFREKLEVTPRSTKMQENRLRWFGHGLGLVRGKKGSVLVGGGWTRSDQTRPNQFRLYQISSDQIRPDQIRPD
ncbi:uncharacterized protein LOC130810691 [Amaranthus tricolor]|uniref:uncharacterized protein LOC130810691 n=1 Tax=Amaranthus tricolor TaxID=29722 RepID=UPI002588F391|nr:uncharacterized protein LOC130810691 [Amaranthus tricolor]